MEYVYYIIGGLVVAVGVIFFLIYRSTKSMSEGIDQEEKERSWFKHL